MSYQIIFLCPHGAAKSVIAAAYCQQLADVQGIPLRVMSAGTEPDSEIAPAVIELLRAEGIDVTGQRPRCVTHEELATADRIISLGCDLGDLAPVGSMIECWDDVPPPSQNLHAARDRIRTYVDRLVATLTQAEGNMSDSAEGAVP
jgi:arsenate reductase (thioredoxin)